MKFDFEKDLILENERVILRPLLAGDHENLLPAALSDENLLQYSPVPVNSAELLELYIKLALKGRDKHLRYPFIIYDKQQEAYAGSSSFMNISNTDSRLEIGSTWFGKSFQRTGLNRNCKFLMMCYVFDELGCERLEYKTDERNIQSRTAIEKIGGKYEGILRSHILMADGFRRNTVSYSILKNEWEDIEFRY